MAVLSLNEIRARAAAFAQDWAKASSEQADKQTFWNEFFEIFGVERKTLALYEEPVKRLGRDKGFIDIFWPGTLIVEHKSLGKPLEAAYDQAADYAKNLNPAEQPRFIITSDFRQVKLYDLTNKDGIISRELFLSDLPKHIDLFSFIAGYEKQEIYEEDPVNRRAAEKLAKLHDELKKTGYAGEYLEILLVRLLFCLFAEDSNIFNKSQFHDFIYNRTEIDGSDLGPKLIQLFEALNKPKDKRQTTLDETIAEFPYVNGHLFEKNIDTPTFDYNMWDMLEKSSHELDWSQISPAIFGAMFQGVMDAEARRALGAHYTSEINIMKVIQPLFLNDLWSEFDQVKDNRSLLNVFHEKLAKLKFLDPACGCGNFLVVAYRELRRLELEILKITYKGDDEVDLKAVVKCNVDQFYGIEIEEFPAQIAQVAMWLTDMQMNNEATDVFGKPLVRLPLTHSATIVHGDALTTDWKDVISPFSLDYLFGNPPFLGKQYQDKQQKEEFSNVWQGVKGAGVLDFVTAWYRKAALYIDGSKIRVAFVSTNSISQGEQVAILWKELFKHQIKINFAHRTFQWNNEARGIAAVHCVIIGFSQKPSDKKIIFTYPNLKSEPFSIAAANINPYLVDAPDIIVEKRKKPINKVPVMNYGSMPNDGGGLLLSQSEFDELIKEEPGAEKWIRKFVMGNELINNINRYCLWLIDISPDELSKLPLVKRRVELVREHRDQSERSTTKELSKTPTLFGEIRQPNGRYLALPRVSSENRVYIPMKFLDQDIIAGDKVYTLQGAGLFHFGILTSRMHMAWMKVTAGRMKSDYSYTNLIVYNNFVWPENVKAEQIAHIEGLAQAILEARAKFKDNSLANLYSAITMPPVLLHAHQALDQAVDKLYRSEKFNDDSSRVAFLFQKYQKLIA